MKKKVSVIGHGVIGKAVRKLFFGKDVIGGVAVYDISNKLLCNSEREEEVNKSDFAFVCVPTPHNRYDGLDMSIVEKAVLKFTSKIFIICSALQPGTADGLRKKYKKRIVVQPEYFGETVEHPLTQLGDQKFLILGGEKEDVKEVIGLYQNVYNANIRIRRVSALEAEVIKLSENRAIAYKVAQCQELYDVCQAANLDYETIRQAVYGDDPRFNLWWTWIYEENRGFNSKCIPKDVYGWCKWGQDNNVNPRLTKDLLEYNDGLING